jgi:hypothetical protein
MEVLSGTGIKIRFCKNNAGPKFTQAYSVKDYEPDVSAPVITKKIYKIARTGFEMHCRFLIFARINP